MQSAQEPLSLANIFIEASQLVVRLYLELGYGPVVVRRGDPGDPQVGVVILNSDLLGLIWLICCSFSECI